MKLFDDLHPNDQIVLVANALEALAYSGYSKIVVAAAAQHLSTAEWWRKICADAGVDECEPWAGYPESPGGATESDRRSEHIAS
jgi:hypothetical protein